MNTKPYTNEYHPALDKYIHLVPDGNLVDILEEQQKNSILMLQDLSEQQAEFKYAEGKWSIKTVAGHIADVERLWNYRILRIARGDARELPGYDRDIFAVSASFDKLPLVNILEDFTAVRQSTITLIKNLEEEAFLRLGLFNDHPLSARAAAFVIAGHEAHHRKIIQMKYLSQLTIE
ncbi:DinB superfamily protein [Gracilibacillus ureilyticus]|uniref:DinB superfamily protein n=1 Tax=Gracilibacillus ureilyticus TaxID=531814 RepID=A0A1H9VAN7_9BACI|nr:DinB family protein [Gracilibacillus ureilyticus]SES18880.1 DinB superfamily protein [Gracilibacillus ureilyticus]